MLRMIAIICFTLTLFCPVFCLADTDSECSDHVQRNDGNCEAMSIGAVVEKSNRGVRTLYQLLPSFNGFLYADAAVSGSACRLQSARWYREHSKPPPTAMRRHALLQSFLF
jgi:hypothetical protein